MNETKKTNHPAVSTSDMEPDPGNAALSENGAKTQDPRISIHVRSIRKRLCDADGISAKAAIDGLVRAGILKDDSPQYVKEVTYSQEKGNQEETIIELLEELERDK